MALTKISRGLLNTGVSDSSDATAITISSTEDVTLTNHLVIGDDKELRLGDSSDVTFKHHNSGYGHLQNTGQLFIDAETISLRTDNSSIGERVTINASGNVGIGTASPGVMLDVRGEIAVDYNATYGLRFYNQSRNNWSSIGNFSTNSNADLNIKTGGGEAVTILHSGNVGIGTTTPGYTLDVNGGSGTMTRFTSGGSSIYLAMKNTSNTGYIGIDGTNMEFYPTGSKVGLLNSSGDLYIDGTLTEDHVFSDERLKENITVISDAVQKVKTLKGITFTRKKDSSEGTGLIAQDLEKVLPQAVYEAEAHFEKNPISGETISELPETYKAIHYGNTVGLLVEAIKELSTKLEAAEARITTLEG